MPQWDVFANPSARSRAELPFLIDVQSDLLAGLATRLVVPCAASQAAQGAVLPRRMTPEFEIQSQRVQLVPHEAGPIAAKLLTRPIVSVRDQAHLIVDALDAVISGV